MVNDYMDSTPKMTLNKESVISPSVNLLFQYVLNPTFETSQIKELDVVSAMSRAFDGTTYLPGIVGMNNIKANDYCNVILQVLI